MPVTLFRMPELPDWSAIRDEITRRDVRAIFKYLRTNGWRLKDIAHAVQSSDSQVSEILSNKRTVMAYDVFVSIADGLNIPRGWMGLAQANYHIIEDKSESMFDMAVKAMTNDSDHRRMIYIQDTPAIKRLNFADVKAIEATFQTLQILDQTSGGIAQYHGSLGLIQHIERCLKHSSMGENVRWELSRKIGWINSFAGWVAADCGHMDNARAHFHKALAVAQETNDPLGKCRALYQSGRVELHYGEPNYATKLFQLGIIPAGEIKSKAFTASFQANIAWATSYTHPHSVVRHVQESKESFHNVNADNEQGNILKYIGWSDLLSCTGPAMANIGKYDAAVKELKSGLGLRSSTNVRSKAFESASLAHAYLDDGETTLGMKHAQEAVSLASSFHSKRTAFRFRAMRQSLARTRSADARELVSTIDTISNVSD